VPSFIDTNIPMYAAGGPHELREPCQQILAVAIGWPDAFFTNAEVLQEIVYRYFSWNRREQGRQRVLEFAALMSDRIEPVFGIDVERAVELGSVHPQLSSRDCVHLAVMERVGCNSVVTADRGFERVAGMRRLHPRDLSIWRHEFGL